MSWTEPFMDLCESLDLAVMAVDAETGAFLGRTGKAKNLMERLSGLSEGALTGLPDLVGNGTWQWAQRLLRAGDSEGVRVPLGDRGEILIGPTREGISPASVTLLAAPYDRGLNPDAENETSARIQRALLSGSGTFSYGGASFAAQTIPSMQVDGDFFEFWKLGGTRVDFVIGDVMGKGVVAALNAAAIKAALNRAVIETLADAPDTLRPSSVIERAQLSLGPELSSMGKFVTLCCGRLEAGKGLLSFVDAGHPGFAYLDSRDGSCWEVKGSNMPIGFVACQTFKEYVLPVRRGDSLVFYSDGITESENSEGELFGTERLLRFVAAHKALPPLKIVEEIMKTAFYYSLSGFRDDATIVAAGIDDDPSGPRSDWREELNRSDGEGLHALRSRFEKALGEALPNGDSRIRAELTLGFMEALGNAIRHTEGTATAGWTIHTGGVTVEIEFRGSDYQWYRVRAPQMRDLPLHGFGSWIMDKTFDSVLLLRGPENKKRLVMTKVSL